VLIIDKYAYTNKLKDFNPMAKFCFSIGLLLSSLIIKNSILHIFIFTIMLIVTVFIAKISLKNYIRILLIPTSFLLLSIIAILISVTKGDIQYIYGLEILNINFVITQESINTATILLSRALASISCIFFLMLTTPINDMTSIFYRLKIPKLFIEMTVLTYRFIFIFIEESREIYIAQNMRFGYAGLRNSYNSLSCLIAVLFIRVFKRYKDMEIALQCRGFDEEFHM